MKSMMLLKMANKFKLVDEDKSVLQKGDKIERYVFRFKKK